MTSIAPPPNAAPHDEIELLAIIRSIWSQKLVVGAMMALCAMIASIFAFNMTPEYKVSTVLRPAPLNDLDELNRTKIYHLTPEEALKRVGASLDSYDTRLSYFRSSQILQAEFRKGDRTVEQAFEEFNSKALKLIHPDARKSDPLNVFVGVDLQYPEGMDGKSVLNNFVLFAIESERQRASRDLEVMVLNRIREVDAALKSARVDYSASKDGQIAELLESDTLQRARLNDELRALRLQLKLRRENRIAELDEAAVIARSLGLKRPSTPSSMSEVGSETSGNVIRTEVTNQRIPLYFMGTDALQAEQQALRRRTSDDFADPRISEVRKELALLETNRKVQVLNARKNEDLFLKGIESLRAERTRLSAINTDLSKLKLVDIDRLAVEPLYPVEPKKSLIIIIGIVLGFVLGILVALLKYALVGRPIEMKEVAFTSLPHVSQSEASALVTLK